MRCQNTTLPTSFLSPCQNVNSTIETLVFLSIGAAVYYLFTYFSHEAPTVADSLLNKECSILEKKYPRFKISLKDYQNNKSLPITYFETQSKEVVSLISKEIEAAKALNTLDACFDEVMAKIARTRYELAENQETTDLLYFGQERKLTLFSPLHLIDHKEYGENFLSLIWKACQNNEMSLKSNRFITIEKPPIQGCSSKFHISLPSRVQLIHSFTCSQDPTLIDRLNSMSPESKESFYANALSHNSFLYARVEFKKDGLSHPLSDYFIFFRNGISYPLSDCHISFDENVSIVLLHQSPEFIEATLKEIKKCFLKCVQSENEEEILFNLALMRYLFAHVAPYQRGSAWTAEILEKAILYPKYAFSYGASSDSGSLPRADLDALLTLTLEDFTKDYLSKVKLKRR